MIRPSGTSKKAIYWQRVYDEIIKRRARPSVGFLTDCTTRGTHRRNIPLVNRRPVEDVQPFRLTHTLTLSSVASRDSQALPSLVTGGFWSGITQGERTLAAPAYIPASPAPAYIYINHPGGAASSLIPDTVIRSDIFTAPIIRFQSTVTTPLEDGVGIGIVELMGFVLTLHTVDTNPNTWTPADVTIEEIEIDGETYWKETPSSGGLVRFTGESILGIKGPSSPRTLIKRRTDNDLRGVGSGLGSTYTPEYALHSASPNSRDQAFWTASSPTITQIHGWVNASTVEWHSARPASPEFWFSEPAYGWPTPNRALLLMRYDQASIDVSIDVSEFVDGKPYFIQGTYGGHPDGNLGAPPQYSTFDLTITPEES